MCALVSKATENNWKRLNTDSNNRLTSRANKKLSTRKIIPIEYIKDKENMSSINDLLTLISQNNWKTEDVIYSLSLNLIYNAKIEKHRNVKNYMKFYSDLNKIDDLINYNQVSQINEDDILGLIYQCLMAEGEKNKKGSYYTSRSVVESMVNDLKFNNNETFLDPCCGSGAYLLSLKVSNPNQIYGVDIDKIAVMIAKINLILKYKDIDFEPKIYNFNFLSENSENNVLNKKFTYIVTNPPWGAITDKNCMPKEIKSGEIFSCFIVKSIKRLDTNGTLKFLLPISILNVKVHKDIREYILKNANLYKIAFYNESFSGVTTKYVDLEINNCQPTPDVIIQNSNKINIESKNAFNLTKNKVFSIIDSDTEKILKSIQNAGCYSLKDSKWALGIVTGDNKNKLSDEKRNGYEPVYTGKEIEKYTLKKPKKFIKYQRENFQQVAKDEYYRAPEKLVYKFISNKLTFAYDNTKSLFLNSANILIPDIPNMSIKTVMAYLNSDLFSFYYQNLFGEIKILKNNLLEIPFPKITANEDKEISNLIDEIIMNKNEESDMKLQRIICKTYNLDEDQIDYILKEVK